MTVCIVNESELVPKSAVTVWDALKESVSNFDSLIYKDQPIKCSAGMLWNVQFKNKNKKYVYDWFRNHNIPIIIGEAGALNRNTLWRISLNNIDNNGIYGLNSKLDPKRPEKLGIKVDPWRYYKGEYILICIQNDNASHWPYSCSGITWLQQTLQEIRKYTKRSIIVRPHPRIGPNVSKRDLVTSNTYLIQPKDKPNFTEILKDAWCVINPSSNPGIDAVLKGIPIFTAKNSLAADVANFELSYIEQPKMPNRDKWLIEISHKEWSIDEIKNNIPYKRIRPFIFSNG